MPDQVDQGLDKSDLITKQVEVSCKLGLVAEGVLELNIFAFELGLDDDTDELEHEPGVEVFFFQDELAVVDQTQINLVVHEADQRVDLRNHQKQFFLNFLADEVRVDQFLEEHENRLQVGSELRRHDRLAIDLLLGPGACRGAGLIKNRLNVVRDVVDVDCHRFDFVELGRLDSHLDVLYGRPRGVLRLLGQLDLVDFQLLGGLINLRLYNLL